LHIDPYPPENIFNLIFFRARQLQKISSMKSIG